MARTVRDAQLQTREARAKLARRHNPYWRLLHPGLHLGYRKGERGGRWIARSYVGGAYRKEVLGNADDATDANDGDVLSFAQAQDKARKWGASHHSGKPGKATTVNDAISDYLDWYRLHRKASKTTEQLIDAHIRSHFGAKRVSDLQTREIKRWLENLAASAPRRRSSKLKSQQFGKKPATQEQRRARQSSANRVLTVLKAILNRAFADELVADDLAWRRVKPFKCADEPIERFLNDAECLRLVNACDKDFRALVQGALLTGARYNELATLRVQNVNLDARTVYFAAAKTAKGRHVPLSPEGVAHFEHFVRGKAPDKLVFTRDDGKPWGKNHQSRLIAAACDVAKITPAIGFHDLRHTFASILAQRGIDLLTISKLLGHSDTRITSRHYAHLCDKTLSDAVQKLPSFGAPPVSNVQSIR